MEVAVYMVFMFCNSFQGELPSNLNSMGWQDDGSDDGGQYSRLMKILFMLVESTIGYQLMMVLHLIAQQDGAIPTKRNMYMQIFMT